jgi:hypothetical protein
MNIQLMLRNSIDKQFDKSQRRRQQGADGTGHARMSRKVKASVCSPTLIEEWDGVNWIVVDSIPCQCAACVHPSDKVKLSMADRLIIAFKQSGAVAEQCYDPYNTESREKAETMRMLKAPLYPGHEINPLYGIDGRIGKPSKAISAVAMSRPTPTSKGVFLTGNGKPVRPPLTHRVR